MYKVPWNTRPLSTGRARLVLLVVAAVLGVRYLDFVFWTGTGVNEPAAVVRVHEWKTLRYRECMVYGILWLLAWASPRFHHRGLFALLVSVLLVVWGYFELMIHSMLPFARP